MSDQPIIDYEAEYEARFAWRRARQIENLKELSEFAQSDGAEAWTAFPKLPGSLVSSDPKDALRWSILILWCEATECYILGEFQSCILTCGAVVERCLKLEYQQAKGTLPVGAKWTLGRCIRECNAVVSAEVLALAGQMLDPRNSRAHALLEHSDPQSSILGGPGCGREVLSSGHALLEFYREDAKAAVEITFAILKNLYQE